MSKLSKDESEVIVGVLTAAVVAVGAAWLLAQAAPVVWTWIMVAP